MLKQYTNLLILAGLVFMMAAVRTDEGGQGSWALYLATLLRLLGAVAPALVLNMLMHRYDLKTALICYGVCLPLTTALFYFTLPFPKGRELYLSTAVFVTGLQLLLYLDEWRRQARLRKKLRWEVSFEKGLMGTLILLSAIFATMAVSSMGNPEYHSQERLLLGFEFSPGKVIAHFADWLSIFIQFLFIYGCGYFIFWFNSRVLVSGILKEKGILVYCLAALASVAILYPVMGQLLAWLPLNTLLGYLFSLNAFKEENAYSFAAILVVSLPVILALQWYAQHNRIMGLEKEKTQAELDMLKQQLNPHFFFNTLNNLYALSLHKSAQTPDMVLGLSDLMRYVIYRGREATVPLREEIQYLEDYIRLEELRLKQPFSLQFEKELERDDYPLAPLLLIVFVENAFKHGIEPADGAAFLCIHLRADSKGLTFTCENAVLETVAGDGGIGLENLRKRLALLYPGKHTIHTGEENHTFKALLHLHWS